MQSHEQPQDGVIACEEAVQDKEQPQDGVRQLADDEHADDGDERHRDVVVKSSARREAATTHAQRAVETCVEVDRRHERAAGAKREKAQRLIHEEVDKTGINYEIRELM